MTPSQSNDLRAESCDDAEFGAMAAQGIVPNRRRLEE